MSKIICQDVGLLLFVGKNKWSLAKRILVILILLTPIHFIINKDHDDVVDDVHAPVKTTTMEYTYDHCTHYV